MNRFFLLLVLMALIPFSACTGQLNFSDSNVKETTRNPVGEKANYQLVHSRSDGIIDSGWIKSEVLISKTNPDKEFNVSMSYFFQTHFSGSRGSTMVVPLIKEFFTPAFLEKLRNSGKYEDSRFVAEYEGKVDSFTTLDGDGTTYQNLDQIYLHDIDPSLSPNQGIEDLEIRALVKEGVPVLGAISLDIKGTDTQGISVRVRVGTDLVSSSGN